MNITSNATIDITRKSPFSFDIGLPVVVVFSSMSAIIGIVHIIYIAACLRIMKQKFFFMLVLALLSCDAVHGFSCVLYTLAEKVEAIRTNVISCQTQVFLLCFSFLSTYTFLFLICLQRYITVRQISLKSYTFTANQFFKRFKYHIIGSSFAVTFIVSFATSFFLPREVQDKYVASCNPEDIYGLFYFRIFYTIIFSPVTIFIGLILSLTILTAYRIRVGFVKVIRSVAPEINISGTGSTRRDNNRVQNFDFCVVSKISKKNDVEALKPSFEIDYSKNKQHVSRSSKLSKRMSQYKRRNEYIDDDENAVEKSNNFLTLETFKRNSIHHDKTREHVQLSTVRASQNKTKRHQQETTIGSMNERAERLNKPFVKNKEEDRAKENAEGIETSISTIEVILNDQQETNLTNNSIEESKTERGTRQITDRRKSWEVKAFITCIYVASTTIVCHSAFIISVWMDIISGNPLPMETKMLLFLPISINVFLNPFLYAWRVQEIRKELKMLCIRCMRFGNNVTFEE